MLFSTGIMPDQEPVKLTTKLKLTAHTANNPINIKTWLIFRSASIRALLIESIFCIVLFSKSSKYLTLESKRFLSDLASPVENRISNPTTTIGRFNKSDTNNPLNTSERSRAINMRMINKRIKTIANPKIPKNLL